MQLLTAANNVAVSATTLGAGCALQADSSTPINQLALTFDANAGVLYHLSVACSGQAGADHPASGDFEGTLEVTFRIGDRSYTQTKQLRAEEDKGFDVNGTRVCPL
ncbi:MAG: hypothetical protein KC503_04450 [Myxococcales bacterium]|nr:hypothetical protein [Myxococcales bacterium]